ncbi:MAG: EAL domain-containing protein, partial [Gammaproteobacteria bacterium]|nr:EAL domain-containing protein [Gammaproteobacteria bacterium]NIR82245.1 EAL domain-containing protein [Gammaproteobacteria bacterium]NIR91176.1 EAL domain-containing protein [Gammaproteobacteria bacterium]NIU03394.1 EAL domain-containing protein [Gammaproteobacteria bacterium]NIX84669.1 EAL domain-containing protein [Gammaproteobacteria bacterium]
IAMAHNLKLRVVAEGVETAEQLALLEERDCDEIQGYYLGRPCSAADAARFLRSRFPAHDAVSPHAANG